MRRYVHVEIEGEEYGRGKEGGSEVERGMREKESQRIRKREQPFLAFYACFRSQH